MAATSSTTAFAADDVDAEVTEGPPVVAGSIKLPAESKVLISIPSCGCSPVPVVPTHQNARNLFNVTISNLWFP